jgi:O-antigen ligase
MDFFMRYALGLLLCSYLLSFHALPWASAHSEALAFLAVVVWCWSAVGRNAGKLRLNIPIKALLALELLIALQYASGDIVFGGDALMLLIYTHLCITVLLVAQVGAGNALWPRSLAFALLAAALASALIALTQALWVWSDSDWIFPHSGFRRPGANMAQPNNLGTLLVMGAASLIYLGQRLNISRVTAVILSMVLLLGIGIIESRTCLLSALGLCLWWIVRSRSNGDASRWPWVLGAVLTLITLVVVWPPFISHIHEPGMAPSLSLSLSQGATINVTAGSRIVVWPQLWQAAWLNPWLGWGLGNVSAAHNAVLHSYPVAEPFTYAHNIVLDMAIGLGLPLTGLALWAGGIWAWRRVRSVESSESWYAVALLIPFAMHSLLEYPFAYAYFLIPAMLAIALLEQHNTIHAGAVISRKVFVASLIAFSGLLGLVAVEYLKIEEDFRVARFEALKVGQTPTGYERPQIILLTQLKALVMATRMEAHPDMSTEGIALLRSVALRFPFVSTLNHYALSLALNGNPQEAVRQLKVMRALYGEEQYAKIRGGWIDLAKAKYPQLKVIEIP